MAMDSQGSCSTAVSSTGAHDSDVDMDWDTASTCSLTREDALLAAFDHFTQILKLPARINRKQYTQWINRKTFPHPLEREHTLPVIESDMPEHAYRHVDMPAVGRAVPISTHPHFVSG